LKIGREKVKPKEKPREVVVETAEMKEANRVSER
jgi:hypothetical protein